MEGYVYVMSNKAMPGLVKVGFTSGKPDERAAQLNGTHSPHPVVVEYATLVPDARAVERETHLRLRKHREGKEWFRCSRELAIDAIKRAVGCLARDEFSRVEQERQQAAHQEQARQHREAEKRARAEDQRNVGLRIAVEQRYGPRMANCFPSFWKVYGWCCVAVWLVIACFPNATFMGGLVGGALLGFIPAFVAKGVLDERAAKSPAYVAAAAERQRELDAIDRSGPPPATASGASAPSNSTASTRTRATAPAPRLMRGDYTIEPPSGTIAADKSPEQRARDRAARVNQDPAT